MLKNLSERIAERVSKKQTRSAQNKTAFLALRSEIKKAINDGWTVKTIWETLHEENKISFGYMAFNNYVNNFKLREKEIDNAKKEKQIDKNISVENKERTEIKKQESFEIEKFTYNPIMNREDLI